MATVAARAGVSISRAVCQGTASKGAAQQKRVAFAPLDLNQTAKQVLRTSFSGTILVSQSCTSSTGHPRRVSARASASASENNDNNKLAPLAPASPAGQLLVQLLQSHPHLFATAAEQQLERLCEDQAEQEQQKEASTSGADLVLYKRINEVRESERKRAVEDIMYACIIQRFMDLGIDLVSNVPTTNEAKGQVIDVGPIKLPLLESVHSPEALEMVKEHIAMVLGGQQNASLPDTHVMAQISRLRVGQVYAASIMYGYFLRRVDQRFQLDKRMRASLGLTEGIPEAEVIQTTETKLETRSEIQSADGEGDRLAQELSAEVAKMAARRSEFELPGTSSAKASALRSYVMGFDQETLQRSATMRSRETVNVIERHTEALFGKPEIIVLDDGRLAIKQTDDTVRISFAGLKKLVLEAVAFGSYLWDVESFVDERYRLVAQ